MTIKLELDEEAADALAAVVKQRNERSGTDISVADHLREIVGAEVLRVKEAAYQESLSQLGEGARLLPYAARKEITAMVRSQIPSPEN